MSISAPTLLIRFTGEDRPGLTAELAAALAEHRATVLDLNQAVIHQSLLLGMMIRPPEPPEAPEPLEAPHPPHADAEASPRAEASGTSATQTHDTTALLDHLRAVAARLDLRLKVEAIPDADYDDWVGRQGKPRHILTLLTRSLTAEQLAAVTRVVADQGLNIDVIHRLSGRPPRKDDPRIPKRACVEFWLRGEPADHDAMHAAFMDLGQRLALDVAWQKDDVYRRMRRMVVFDMDSTLIQAEVIDELAKEAGAGERVAAITAAAMRGELDFDDSLRQRVATLRGLPESVLGKVAERLPLTEGTDTLLHNLKSFGYKTAVLSGGFTYFGRHLQRRLGLDHVHANELEIVDGVLTGRVTGPIINGPRKAELLEQLAAKEGIDPRQVVAVGDGANDLPMLNRAGLGIAFHAKPIVRRQAEHSVSTLGLDALLYLLGVRDRQRLVLPVG